MEDEATVTEQLAFRSVSDLEEFLAFSEKSREAHEITDYEKLFSGKNPTFRVFEEV